MESVAQEAHPQDDSVPPIRREDVFETTRPFDVDGDGVLDTLVPTVPPGRCAAEVDWAVYVMRGECGHHVGRVTGRPLTLEDESHGGLRDIRANRRWFELEDSSRPAGPENVAVLHEVTTIWAAVDPHGSRSHLHYEPSEREVSEGICHHCAIASCRTLSGPPPAEVSCDPLPREGDICEGHGFCAIDWGSPGGQSTALWCRGGRWVIESESNETTP